MSKSRLCLLVAWNNSQNLLLQKHSQTCGSTTEHASPRISLQIISLKLGRSGKSLEGKEVKKEIIPSKDETSKYWNTVGFFFFGRVAFPAQPSVSHCSRANKAAAEGDLLLQWSWLHTLSNLHNLPPNLNQLKCTPGDYIQKPIWKNIHCLTLKSPGERKQSGRGCSSWKESKKKNRNKDLAFTFVSLF